LQLNVKLTEEKVKLEEEIVKLKKENLELINKNEVQEQQNVLLSKQIVEMKKTNGMLGKQNSKYYDENKRLLESEEVLTKDLGSAQGYSTKIITWIRRVVEKGKCKTFAFNFEEVIVPDQHEIWTKKIDIDKDKTWEGYLGDTQKKKNAFKIIQNTIRELLNTHFHKGVTNIVIYSSLSPANLLELWMPDMNHVKFEFIGRGDQVWGNSHGKTDALTEMLLHLIRTQNIEWYEILFVYTTEPDNINVNGLEVNAKDLGLLTERIKNCSPK